MLNSNRECRTRCLHRRLKSNWKKGKRDKKGMMEKMLVVKKKKEKNPKRSK